MWTCGFLTPLLTATTLLSLKPDSQLGFEEGQTSNREKLVVFAANVALSSRYYPIPENYWPENINGMPVSSNFFLTFPMHNNNPLYQPARQSQPTIYFSVADETHFSLPDGFPCDRHSMQQGALCSRLGSKSKGTCWPVKLIYYSYLFLLHAQLSSSPSPLNL